VNEILDYTFLGNSVENWLFALGFAFGGILIAKLLYWFFGKIFRSVASKTKSKLDDILVDKLEEPMVFAVIIFFAWWGYDYLHFDEGVDVWIQRIFKVHLAINLTWIVARLVDGILTEYLMPYSSAKENATLEQVLPIVKKGIAVIIWTLGIVLALNNAGYDVGALIAGVGIGGLAMAMAAKDFVANIFGGITVFIDKPFMVNDRIQIDGYDGFVKEIGIRSTRLQTLEGRMVTVPNHKFTDSFVTNVTAEPTRRVKVTVGLVYSTTPEQIEEGRQIMCEVAMGHPFTTEEIHVWFENLGDFSLNISMFYFITKEGDLFAVPGEINLEILRRFNDAGLSFAFPTQTLYHLDLANQGK
jgi:MscS family membrane protein